MVTRFIPQRDAIHQASSAWAKANASDPWAYSRCKLHLELNCHTQGLPSEILEDSERILKARTKLHHRGA